VFRIEGRDYISPFPTEVITPRWGYVRHTIMHDFVPMAGFGFLF